MKAAAALGSQVGKKPACEALKVPYATLYRHLKDPPIEKAMRPSPPLALTSQERHKCGHSPVRSLSDRVKPLTRPTPSFSMKGQYHCPIQTMNRILAAKHGNIKERGRQVQRPAYAKSAWADHPPLSGLVTGYNQAERAREADPFHHYLIMDI